MSFSHFFFSFLPTSVGNVCVSGACAMSHVSAMYEDTPLSGGAGASCPGPGRAEEGVPGPDGDSGEAEVHQGGGPAGGQRDRKSVV